MKIELTHEILKKQAKLIQEFGARLDPNTGGEIYPTLASCYYLLRETYNIALSDEWKKLINPLLQDGINGDIH